jgi:hypothetical protein
VTVASGPVAGGGFPAWAVPWWGGDALPVGEFFKNLHVTLPPIGAISFENFQARTSPVGGGSVWPSQRLSRLGSAMVGR